MSANDVMLQLMDVVNEANKAVHEIKKKAQEDAINEAIEALSNPQTGAEIEIEKQQKRAAAEENQDMLNEVRKQFRQEVAEIGGGNEGSAQAVREKVAQGLEDLKLQSQIKNNQQDQRWDRERNERINKTKAKKIEDDQQKEQADKERAEANKEREKAEKERRAEKEHDKAEKERQAEKERSSEGGYEV